MLKRTFFQLLDKYTDDQSLINEYWSEIVYRHSEETRYYHTLEHLRNLLMRLEEVKSEIENWDTILFTLYYHDIVYHSVSKDNEEQSAMLAKKRMGELSVPDYMIEDCVTQILATKSHKLAENQDINYFLDADLSILGFEWKTYLQYSKDVRNEYIVYPDMVYNMGRKRVLNHFLGMERIFKTAYFFNQYEKSAVENLTKELLSL